MTNPFDLKAAFLAKHAQHVVLIHFPIALCLTAAAFDLLARWTKQSTLAAVAYCNLFVAALMTLPAVATGLLAWQWLLEGRALKGNLLLHLVFGIAASLLIWLAWWLRVLARRRGLERVPNFVIAVEVLAVTAVVLAAHVGGILSGVNAVN